MCVDILRGGSKKLNTNCISHYAYLHLIGYLYINRRFHYSVEMGVWGCGQDSSDSE